MAFSPLIDVYVTSPLKSNIITANHAPSSRLFSRAFRIKSACLAWCRSNVYLKICLSLFIYSSGTLTHSWLFVCVCVCGCVWNVSSFILNSLSLQHLKKWKRGWGSLCTVVLFFPHALSTSVFPSFSLFHSTPQPYTSSFHLSCFTYIDPRCGDYCCQ